MLAADWHDAVQHFDEVAAERLGLHLTDLRILGQLYRGGSMTAGTLGMEVGLSSGSMTAALDRLQKSGLVRRIRDTQDRRKVLIELTSTGTESSRQIWDPMVQGAAELLNAYSETELAVINRFMRQAIKLQTAHVERLVRTESIVGRQPRSAAR